MKPHTTRAYNNFHIHDEICKITKVSETSRLQDEIGYYCAIKKTHFSHFFPRFFNYNNKQAPYELELEYYDYDDLGLQMTEERTVTAPTFGKYWNSIAEKLVRILHTFRTDTDPSLAATRLKDEMYVVKTLHYQEELVNSFDFFAELNKKREIKLNGEIILNFDYIWHDVAKLISKTLMHDTPLSLIHGDMCFSNILCSRRKNIMKFVDPRGSFGAQGVYGDPKYDIAKLLHSFEGGYEYIINDKFNLKVGDEIVFDFANNNLEIIQDVFKDYPLFLDLDAKLIEGLIFVGMCSRHYDSLERQIVMYLTGLKILNKLIS